MTYVPVVDPNECSAHGDCVEVAPQVFRLEDTAVVIGTGPDGLILEAAESCPGGRDHGDRRRDGGDGLSLANMKSR